MYFHYETKGKHANHVSQSTKALGKCRIHLIYGEVHHSEIHHCVINRVSKTDESEVG
jgi:hypothetical protein